MATLGVLLISEDPSLRSTIITLLEAADGFELRETVEQARDLEDAAWRLVPDLIVATLGDHPDPVLDGIASLGDRCPEVVLCGPDERSDLIIRSMRIGVREYIPLPMKSDELTRVLDRISQARESRGQVRRGHIVSVLGAKGGVGATTIACQAGSFLQGSGIQTAIVDLNLQSGDVALYHDLSPTFGVADLERESGDVDKTYIHSLIEVHGSGVGLMASPLQAHRPPTLRPSRLQHALGLMKEFNEMVLIDLPRDFGDLALAAIELTDQVLVVTSLDVPSLAHCKMQLRLLSQSGVPRNAIQVISNNSDPLTNLSEKDVRGFLGRPIDLRVPRDAATVMEAVNKGASVSAISPRSDIALAVYDLAAELGKRCGRGDTRNPAPARGMSRVKNLIMGGRYGTP